jgi:uncharacterized protein with PIN domain
MDEVKKLKEEIAKYTIKNADSLKKLKLIDELEAELLRKQQKYARMLYKGICPECASDLEKKQEKQLLMVGEKEQKVKDFVKCVKCDFKFEIKQ